MIDIREILQEIELHDASIESVTIKGDGTAELLLDIDDVWNGANASGIKGIWFHSVYEVSDFKIDRLNVIGSIEVEVIEGYNKEFVAHSDGEPEHVLMVSCKLAAGGSLNLICSGLVELLQIQS